MSAQRSQQQAGGTAGAARGSRLRGWIAGGAAVAVIATVAVVSSGFDSRETPRAEPSVWVARDAGQYARVNTDTGEIDTVRKVGEPSGVLQRGERSVVLTRGNGQAWPVDAADPQDLVDNQQSSGGDSESDVPGAGATPVGDGESPDPAADEDAGALASAVKLPEGTREVLGAGEFVAARTESGQIYIGTTVEDLSRIDPLAEDGDGADAGGEEAGTAGEDADAGEFVAAAIALSDRGRLAAYSAEDGTVVSYDAARDRFEGGPVQLPEEALGIQQAEMAFVAHEWVLLDPEGGRVFRAQGGASEIAFQGTPRLQRTGDGDGPGAGGGSAALVADAAGLWRVPKTGEAERIAEATGSPARPVTAEGRRYAAWIGQSSGELWRSGAEPGDEVQTLEFDESVGELGDVDPRFYSNGERAVLGESRSGMLWTLPDGALIPLSQWTISDPPKEDRGTVVVEEVTEQVPPTARDDAFGVRPGEPSQLQVLLNDFDANKRDVLSIVPESLSESPLPAEFGTLELLPDAQAIMVHPAADAKGSASFTYRITDGGLSSQVATVTLTVAADDANTAPEWCPVVGCQREWAVPAIAPGGTLVYPLLDGWVDPEGDSMLLADVETLRPEDPARALVTADGRLAVKHLDPNAGPSEVLLRVTVRDGRGAERQRDLQVPVEPNASPEFAGTAKTVSIGEAQVFHPLTRVSGGSGSFALVDATVQTGGDRVSVTVRQADGSIELAASSAGHALVSLEIRDIITGAEISGIVRITATQEQSRLALPPLRAFVRPLSDTTIEVLDAIPGAQGRALAVTGAPVVDGQLRADVIEHSRIRVAGSTEDGGPGRIGSADVVVSEGKQQTVGRLTVFQVPESGEGGAVAVADTATVRAGDVVDIRVLDNDVTAPGERLVLHPEITGSGAKGELAFASGSVLRYLAPKQPGTYRLSYTTYGASSPEASDVGSVTVTVLPTGSNADPQPRTLTVRVAPGEQSEVRVPLSGVDPDGDRVRLDSISQADDAQVTATITPARNAFAIGASEKAEPGQHWLNYTVSDGKGGTGSARVQVIVTEQLDAGAPVVSSDYVRVALGTKDPVAVRPLENDIDPAHGTLKILSVEPNLPGGDKHPEYARAAARLDLAELKRGVVGVLPGGEPGTASYRYTVQSSASKSTADGLILVHTSERVGTQAPSISDTIMSVRDRSDLEGKGIDVVTDKVRWSAGDASKLKLSLWGGNSSDYRVSGNRIIGSYNPKGDRVVFKLSGTDASGTSVESYGFLVVPPLDELRLTLRAGLDPLQVDENKTVDADITKLVDIGSGDRVELKQGSFPVSRAEASCAATSSTGLRYSAGGEAPWADACLIEARLVGQDTWTTLAVPVNVVPRAPVATLNPLTRTVAPGASETITLTDMVTWQGGREGETSKLRFEVSGGGPMFTVSPSGSSVTVEARADAVPGSQENLSIAVSGSGESRAPLVLRVGEAPKDLPRGATVDLRCTVGSSCTANVVGVPGEHDPFAGKQGGGLKLQSVNGSSCSFGTVSRVGDSGVSVAWPENRGPGGRCTVGFTVRDAQGRAGEGSIELDAQGVPRAPSSIQATGATGSSVTLTVALSAQSAHPEVTGVELVSSGGAVGSCALSGSTAQCTVTGVTPGKEHQQTYFARAVNGVGSSDQTANGVATWAYAPPSTPKVDASVKKDSTNTERDSGQVDLRISDSESAKRFMLTIDGGTPTEVGRSTTHTLAPGPHTFSVTPENQELPPGYMGSGQGSVGTARVVVGAAPRPGESWIESGGRGEGKATIRTSGWSNNHADSVTYTYGLAAGGRTPQCTQESPEFSGIEPYESYSGIVCAVSEFGTTRAQIGSTWIGGLPGELRVDGYYTVSGTPSGSDRVREYTGVTGQPQLFGTVWRAKLYYSNGEQGRLTWAPVGGGVTVMQCIGDPSAGRCSGPSAVDDPDNGVTPVRITQQANCVAADGDLAGLFKIEGRGPVQPAYTVTGSDIQVSWPDSSWEPVTFAGAVCQPSEPPTPPPAP